MTVAELSALESHGPWTTDDLDELPESTRHHELIDGVLIVPPAPTYLHQTVIVRLATVLDESCPELVVKTYRLGQATELYRSTGDFSDKVTIDEPWPIDFPVSRLVPRHDRAE